MAAVGGGWAVGNAAPRSSGCHSLSYSWGNDLAFLVEYEALGFALLLLRERIELIGIEKI